MNLPNILWAADRASLKVLKEGTGTIDTSAGLNAVGTATIPHGYGSDKLLWQVSLRDGSTGQVYITLFWSNDSRYQLFSELDSTNLYIIISLSSGGSPFPAITWTYNYRILIP